MAIKKFKQNDNNLAIAYYRYSSHAQNEASIDQQAEQAHLWADAHDYQIIREYKDEAKSGTTDDRPGYQQMLAEIAQLKPAVLILWKTDRLGRDRYELAIAKQRIRNSGCALQCVAEALPTDGKEAVLMESMVDGLAEYYSLNLSENVTRGMRAGAEKGETLGRSLLGYRKGADKRYEIDPDTAPIVQRIFEKYAAGDTMADIAAELNAQGLTTSRGNKFTINGLRTILQNDSYIGVYRFSDVVIEDGMPALVSKETFEKVQAQLSLNKHRGAQKARGLDEQDIPRFWLTGKLFCGECGTGMNGHSGTSWTGAKHYYYGCPEHRRGNCKKSHVRKERIEELVVEVLSELLDETDNVSALAFDTAEYYREHANDDAYIKTLKSELASTETSLKNLVKALEQGIFSETTRERLTELEDRKKALIASIEAEEAKRKLMANEQSIKEHYRKFWHADMNDLATRTMVLDYFIDRIYLYEDRLVITGSFFNSGAPPGEREALFKQLSDGSLRFESFAFSPTSKSAGQTICLACFTIARLIPISFTVHALSPASLMVHALWNNVSHGSRTFQR